MRTGTSRPLSSTSGGRPGEKIRSLIFSELRSMADNKAGVETAGATRASRLPLFSEIVGLTRVDTMQPPGHRSWQRTRTSGREDPDRPMTLLMHGAGQRMVTPFRAYGRSEERRVGKECRSR